MKKNKKKAFLSEIAGYLPVSSDLPKMAANIENKGNSDKFAKQNGMA